MKRKTLNWSLWCWSTLHIRLQPKCTTMKKTILFLLIALTVGYRPANAQVHISVNIGSQPVWGPYGYDYAEYYYLPDIDMFYYIPGQQWVFMRNGRWIFAYDLPPRYRGYDLYNCYKVVINEPRPYMRYDVYRSRYAGYRGRRGQVVIRDCSDPRYYVVSGHPRHREWRGGYEPRRNDNRYYRDNDRYSNGRGDNHRRGDYGRGRGNDHNEDGHGHDHDHRDGRRR